MRPTLRLLNLTRVTLTAPSPFVRTRGTPALTPAIAGDFTFFPTYFSPQDSRTLLDAALWKLDRGDYTRRRRRRASAPVVGEGALQEAFSGEYGFEEVRRPLGALTAGPLRQRDPPIP